MANVCVQHRLALLAKEMPFAGFIPNRNRSDMGFQSSLALFGKKVCRCAEIRCNLQVMQGLKLSKVSQVHVFSVSLVVVD